MANSSDINGHGHSRRGARERGKRADRRKGAKTRLSSPSSPARISANMAAAPPLEGIAQNYRLHRLRPQGSAPPLTLGLP
jgi:hypothetical protein